MSHVRNSFSRLNALLFLTGIFVVISGSTARADLLSVNWGALPYTDHGVLQGVDANGVRTYPSGSAGLPVRMVGVLLNNPEDMLDGTAFSPNPVPFNLGAMWQVFVQSVDVNSTGDYGGTAVFMGQHYGNMPPNLEFTPAPTPDPTRSYTNEQWEAEMARVNYDRTTGHQFRAGDLVEIRGQGALYFGGKTNINEEHFIESELDFELVLLEAGYGLPTAVALTLAEIWDDSTGNVLFDASRQTGGERYQSSLVTLLGVELVDDGSLWAPGELVMVQDADGRQFPLNLGLNPLFDTAPDGFFNVTGIFNQEASGSQGGRDGYQLWVMDPTQITAVPEPATLLLALIAAPVLWILRRRAG